ncbi:MAG: hypothetical protein ACM3O8_10375 [Methylococcaceae bacterium]
MEIRVMRLLAAFQRGASVSNRACSICIQSYTLGKIKGLQKSFLFDILLRLRLEVTGPGDTLDGVLRFPTELAVSAFKATLLAKLKAFKNPSFLIYYYGCDWKSQDPVIPWMGCVGFQPSLQYLHSKLRSWKN